MLFKPWGMKMLKKITKTTKLIHECAPFYVCEFVQILQTWALLSYGIRHLSDYSLIFYYMNIHSCISTAGLSLLITYYMEENQGCPLDQTTKHTHTHTREQETLNLETLHANQKHLNAIYIRYSFLRPTRTTIFLKPPKVCHAV